MVAVVPIFDDLAFNAVLPHRTCTFSDVVMGANENKVIWIT